MEPVVRCANLLGEGASWSPRERRLNWVDIAGRAFWSLDPATGAVTTREVADRPTVLVERAGGGYMAAFDRGFQALTADGTPAGDLIAIEPDLPTRLNDGRCDRQGRLLCGSMSEATPKEPIGSLWRLDAGGRVAALVGGLAIANSICFSPDGRTLYLADTPTRRIMAYRYDPDEGVAHEPRLFVDLAGHPGAPDGSTVDASGCLWNASWGGGIVTRFTPDGRIDRIVEVGARQATCPAFGGPGLRTLYCTSARIHLSEAELAADPLAGALFAIKLDVEGLPETPFAG